MRVLLVLVAFAASFPGAQKPVVLTHAAEVRTLTPEQAKAGLPVHVRGVITGDVPSPDYFIHDGSAGIYVEGNKAFKHHLGDYVELDGVTAPGRFAPVIHEQSSHVLGRGTLPKAKLRSFREFAGGQFDSQWMQVKGVVRSVSVDRQSWHEAALAIELDSGGGQFEVPHV